MLRDRGGAGLKGMTLKQAAKARFWDALEAYKEALRTKTGIVPASVRIHAALGQVPKSYRKYVTQAWRDAQP